MIISLIIYFVARLAIIAWLLSMYQSGIMTFWSPKLCWIWEAPYDKKKPSLFSQGDIKDKTEVCKQQTVGSFRNRSLGNDQENFIFTYIQKDEGVQIAWYSNWNTHLTICPTSLTYCEAPRCESAYTSIRPGHIYINGRVFCVYLKCINRLCKDFMTAQFAHIEATGLICFKMCLNV